MKSPTNLFSPSSAAPNRNALLGPSATVNAFKPSRVSGLTSSIAMTFTLKRLLSILMLPPLIVIFTPFFISSCIYILDVISKGYAWSSIFCTVFISLYIRKLIAIYAPSKEKRDNALRSVQEPVFYARLFLGILLVFRFLISWMLHSVHMVRSTISPRSSIYSYQKVFNIALGMFFLDLLVALRYVGFLAIAQCSTYPLPWNPYNQVLSTIKSFRGIVDALSTPDASQERMSTITTSRPNSFPLRGSVGGISNSIKRSNKKGLIRYKEPTLFKSGSQIVVHGFFGALFYQSTLDPVIREWCHYNPSSPWDNQEYHTQKAFVMCCCILMSCFSLLATYFSDSYHELSPKLFVLSRNTTAQDLVRKLSQILVNQIQSRGLLFYFIFLPVVSLFVSGPFQQENAAILPTIMLDMKVLMIAYLATLFLAIYLMMMDIVVRTTLLQPGLNVVSLLSEGIEKANVIRSESGIKSNNSSAIDTDDISEPIAVEDVMVEILLGGLGPTVIDFVNSPRVVIHQDGVMERTSKFRSSATNMHIDLGEEEYRRNKAVISATVDLIETGLVAGHLSFEDDLLKLSVLEAFGGPNQNQEGGLPFGLSWRHYKVLRRCLDGDNVTRGTKIPSGGVPILRSICIYIGAIGEILSKPSSSSMFSLSPGLLQSLQYAVHAAARMIVFNMTFEPGNLESKGKRLNRMTLLLSTVVESIYSIRRGMLSYGRQLYESNNTHVHMNDSISHNFQGHGARIYHAAESFENFLAVKYGSIMNLVNACDDCGSMIVRELNSVDGSRDFDIKVHSQCREWFLSILA